MLPTRYTVIVSHSKLITISMLIRKSCFITRKLHTGKYYENHFGFAIERKQEDQSFVIRIHLRF